MTDISLDIASGTNRPEYTVSEVSQAIRRTVEESFSHIRVRGEISRLTIARSGHMYLTLKDENAVLDSVCWRGTASHLGIQPEEGLEVIVTGRLSTYAGRSSYQIIIEQMELAGEGALLKLLEDRRKKLLAEGLFDEVNKRPLPYIPEVIGVVTSPTGAVIRDILHRLRDRFPRHVIIWPANVQGEGAAEQIANAIEGFNSIEADGRVPRPDLLIVARGGGSLEDLWAFNEELVVRAVAASEIPLISAIGHEADTTLVDFASDRRAPTPSAAAEIAVPVRVELAAIIGDMGARLLPAVQRQLNSSSKEVTGLARGIPAPNRLTEATSQRLDDRIERLEMAKDKLLTEFEARVREAISGLFNPTQQIVHKQDTLHSATRAWRQSLVGIINQKFNELEKANLILEGVSYQRVLDRGFALVTDEYGTTISARTTLPGMDIDIRFHDGEVKARIKGDVVSKSNPPKTSKPKRLNTTVDDDPQGNLL